MAQGSVAYGDLRYPTVCSRCGGKVTSADKTGAMYHFDLVSMTGTTTCVTCLLSSVTCHTARA